ncbi:TPA: hypothetical protein DIS56_02590 [Candidatus Saccharibacteria bacterium]|nr:MAG: hypothetical protein UX30_C0003G0123 [Candidatus Saccharibacteria bacterium GW2011_GWA2_46_10]OGL36306.1 MAG: hypothetical protein A3F05_03270 [Candidatus Saccharibacteria bacterium RIFCSPHIGHO2_12_FULL_47_17]HCM51998.1 hypothetical protein [Candidatus Saccharibacteria bacterium]
MRRREIILISSAAVIAAIIALTVSSMVFNAPSSRSKVPVVEAIKPSFPDVKNDPAYSTFLNRNALDPTQPIQIGNTKNTSPFNPTQ